MEWVTKGNDEWQTMLMARIHGAMLGGMPVFGYLQTEKV